MLPFGAGAVVIALEMPLGLLSDSPGTVALAMKIPVVFAFGTLLGLSLPLKHL